MNILSSILIVLASFGVLLGVMEPRSPGFAIGQVFALLAIAAAILSTRK